jgi:pyrroloquinoline quinone (PQQ) biosynthesis protein C
MTNMDKLLHAFRGIHAEFEASPAMARLRSGGMSVAHYRSYLRQTYHYTRDNPQIQALAAVYFRGDDRASVRAFLKHATSEIDHDAMALADLAELGEDVAEVRRENPLPETVALNAFVFYQINNRNPIGYLGYLFFLEFLPTASGAAYMAMLEQAGVPRSAMSFLLEHATVDVHHNRLMERYAATLIRSEADLDAVIYAMRATGRLYAAMMIAAIEQAESPRDWGVCHEEAARLEGRAAAREPVPEDA